jgi:hypothetical protein
MLQKQIIRDLIIQIFLEKNKPLPEYLIHKILFQYKMNITKENPELASNLPFYWYRHGEFSQPVAETIGELVAEGILTQYPLRHKYRKGNLYSLHKINLGTYRSALAPNDIDRLKTVIDSFDETMGGEFNRELYLKYAPYEFQTSYNKNYLELLNDIIYGDITFQKRHASELKNALIECEAELVPDPLFCEFNDLFSSYCTIAYRIFDYYKGEGSDKSYFEDMAYVSQRIWEVFVDGLRILDNAHDPFYNNMVDSWKVKFGEDIEALKVTLHDFSNTVKEKMRKDGFPRVSRSKHKDVISSTVDGYFT